MALMSSDRETPRRRSHRRRGSSGSGSVDYRKEFAQLYSGSDKRVDLIHAPKMNYLAVDGAGDLIATPEFRIAADLLGRVSLEIRLAVSRAEVMDFAVMPVECLWWDRNVTDPEPSEPKWSAMIMQPVVSPATLEDALERLTGEVEDLDLLRRVRLVKFYEGPAAQTLSRSPEPCCQAALDRLAGWIATSGHVASGPLHEVFLDGPFVAPGARSQRILRQPVTPLPHA